MTEHASRNTDFDSSNLLLFIVRWFRPLALITITAAILSAIVSLMIDEKYKATVVLFPANTGSTSRAVIEGTGRDALIFGEETEAEQLLQILHADEIRERIIDKYDLARHYGIDSVSASYRDILKKEYESNISFRRTEFMSVEIEVLDEDPVLAARIANDIADLSDSVYYKVQKRKAQEILRLVTNEYNTKEREVRAMEDSLKVLRSKGVFDYELQIEILSEQHEQALIEGKANVAKSIEAKFDSLAKYGSAAISLKARMELANERLMHLKKIRDMAEVDIKQAVPHKFVVNNATPSYKKVYPVRWLVVFVSTVSAFILGLLVIMTMQKLRNITPGRA